ncbi:MAG TPA: MFS transporter [Novosphingobium sp.]|nr:MFS transporter [Novosphingobium sp.]
MTAITSELRRHWRVLPPSLAGITLCAVHGYSLGVMIAPLEAEFGWSRAGISGGLFLIAMLALVCAPLTGHAVDRFGPRRIALTGVTLYCLLLASLSFATANIWTWWLLWGLVGLGNMLILPTVWTKAINARFDKARGIALALALCGTGLAAAVVPVLGQWLVSVWGWRGAYVGLAMLGFLFAFPLAWFLFDPPAAAGAAKAEPPPEYDQGVSVADGYRMASFFKLAGAIWLFSMMICALTTNAVPVMMAQGLTPATAAATAGLVGVGSIIGRLLGGYLLDRFDAATIAAISVIMPIGTVGLLLGFPGSTAAAAAAALVLGLSVGTEVDCCAYLAARHFGTRSFGALFGTMNGLMLFGNGIAPVVANHVYDVTLSYDLVLWAQIPGCILTAALFLWLGPYPRFEGGKAVPAT